MSILNTKISSSNLPNITRLKIIPVSQVTRIRRPASPTSHLLPLRPVRVKAGKIFLPLVTVPGYASFKESKVTDTAGVRYPIVIETFLPSDSAAIRAELLALADERFLVAFTDSNGISYLAGTKESPIIMVDDFSNAGDKGRKITFTCSPAKPAYILQSYAESSLTSSSPDPLP